MLAPTALRTAPLRAAVRLKTLREVDSDAGMTTAEYAVGTVAACGFSGILYKLLTSDFILELLKGVIGKAFSFSF